MLPLVLFVSLSASPGTVMVVPPEPATPPAAAPPAAASVTVAPTPAPAPGPAPSPAAAAEAAWVAEAVADLLPRVLSQAGIAAVTREDRLRAQATLEIPPVPLTRATSIRLAEALGATRLVVGSYAVDGPNLSLSLRLLDTERGTLSAPLVTSGPMEGLAGLVHGLAWDIALAGPVPPALSREEFAARRPAVRFEALRAYGQGLSSRNAANQMKLMRRALMLDPAFHEARLALGQLQIEAGEFSAGHDTLARIPVASSYSRAARFLQGVAQLEVGRYHEAAALYARLADELPSAAVLNNQALAQLRVGIKEPRASSLLRRAVEMVPDSLDLAFNLAWALLTEGDAAAAEFFLRDLLRREPLDSHGRVALVWALRRAGRAAEAAEEWKGVLALSPHFEGLARPDLSRRFERVLPAERLVVLERGARTPPEVAAGLIGRAERLTAAGDAQGALRELERAAYLDPHAPRIHLLLARAYRLSGLRDRAVSEYQMTLWADEDPAVRAELAGLLKEMGRVREARAEAQKVLRLDPQNETARKVLQP